MCLKKELSSVTLSIRMNRNWKTEVHRRKNKCVNWLSVPTSYTAFKKILILKSILNPR